MRNFDSQKPRNKFPFSPPKEEIENNPVILKRLVLASRALATLNVMSAIYKA